MIDHARFFTAYRAVYGKLKQSQVNGLTFLLTALEQDEALQDVRWQAYCLATTRHETGDTWQPIEEWGKGKDKPYGRLVTMLDVQGRPHQVGYWGRGFAQVSWQDNYRKFARLLKLDLVVHPELALEPQTAYRILSLGMTRGLFTGKKLADYIHGEVCDYRTARKIINGLDRADLIAGYAVELEQMLRQATATPAA